MPSPRGSNEPRRRGQLWLMHLQIANDKSYSFCLQDDIVGHLIFHKITGSPVTNITPSHIHTRLFLYIIVYLKFTDLYLNCSAGVDLLLVKAVPLLAMLVLRKWRTNYLLSICGLEVRVWMWGCNFSRHLQYVIVVFLQPLQVRG